MMRAIDFEGFGDASVLKSIRVSKPALRATDLLVRVHGAGVNRADLNQRRGSYGRQDFGDSTLMGLEIAGEVVAIGDQASGFALGDPVMGIVGGGGYAEFARIDYRMAVKVPDNIPLIEAAAIPEAFITAHEVIIHLADAQVAEMILIRGAAGGIGTAMVQVARELGAIPIGTGSAGVLSHLRSLGCQQAFDYRDPNLTERIKASAGGRGIDVAVDMVGGGAWVNSLKLLAEGGRLIQLGVMAGNESSILLDILLFRRLRVIGSVMKSRSAEEKIAMTARFADRWLPALAEGTIRPVIHQIFSMSEVADAHRLMEAGGVFGKIVIDIRN